MDDLPAGHPIITRETLDSIAEYAFTTLRGLTLLGGQAKMDTNMLMQNSSSSKSPAESVISILKPAALAFLEIDSNLPRFDESDDDPKVVLEYTLDRSSLEYEFTLNATSFALCANALSTLAINRPAFFREAATCLARRTVQPPTTSSNALLSTSSILALTSQFRACCLTLLRNPLSVMMKGAHPVLHMALVQADMTLQADKALSMAQQAKALKTAGRAARNRANLFYQWDASEEQEKADANDSGRRRTTDTALAEMRAAKKARGLGQGIQLPKSMADAVELILKNLEHLPEQRPAVASSSATNDKDNQEKEAISLESVVDAVMTNGASLSQKEGHWYVRDGGNSTWKVQLRTSVVDDDAMDTGEEKKEEKEATYELDPTLLESLRLERVKDDDEVTRKRRETYKEQSQAAATSAMGRIMSSTIALSSAKSNHLGQLGHQLTSRLAFCLQGAQLNATQAEQLQLAKEGVESVSSRLDEATKSSIVTLFNMYPLVGVALVADVLSSGETKAEGQPSLFEFVLNEAMMQSCPIVGADEDNTNNPTEDKLWKYDATLMSLVATIIHTAERSNNKPADADLKKIANAASVKLHRSILRLPRVTEKALTLATALCDIDDITKKASSSSSRQSGADAIAAAAATHAAKVAAEKRAKVALLILRDIAFLRDQSTLRRAAVQCAVRVATGSLPTSTKIQEQALNFVVNVLYTKNDRIAVMVTESATKQLRQASENAVALYASVEKANKAEESKNKSTLKKNPLAPKSEEEKAAIVKMKGPALVYMALCLRKPTLIEKLFELSSIPKADVLCKAVRINIGKLAKASAAKHGPKQIILQVAEMTGSLGTPLLLSFLEALAPTTDRSLPEQDIIEACFKIQEMKKAENDGKKDLRYVFPIISSMLRQDLIKLLPELIAVEDTSLFLAIMARMGDRLSRQALLFRDEPDEATPTLKGMSLCEQLVFLHRVDFAEAKIPQKQYLTSISMCLNDEDVYNDQVVMSALDHMSGLFLQGTAELPVPFMRTCIMVCSQHESLHAWFCNELLPRLVDGKVYEYPRLWEGWMRCAQMLEKGANNVSSSQAIAKLPPEQMMQYRTRRAAK